MRGGSLTRFRPDDQSGNGFIQDFIRASAQEGWKGLKTGGLLVFAVSREVVNEPSNAKHCKRSTKWPKEK